MSLAETRRRRGRHSVPVLALADTRLSTWEERDRAHVELINAKNDSTIVEWWDEAVAEAVQDGFLKPGKLHESAYDYAVHVGLIQRPQHAHWTQTQHPLPRARENPVARDFTDPTPALKAAVEKHGATHVVWYEKESGPTGFSVRGRVRSQSSDPKVIGVVYAYAPRKGGGYTERQLYVNKGLWHWPDHGKHVKKLPSDAEPIEEVVRRESRECGCSHGCGSRQVQENPVNVTDGIPWVKTERNAEDFEEVRAVAEKVGPIKGSRDIYELMRPWAARQDKEHLCVVLLDIHSMLRGVAIIHIGQRDRVAVDPADVLKPAIERGAKGLCILHNHPSGSAQHSPADARLTKAIEKACDTNDIAFVDHVVMGSGEYYSFRDKKLHKVR
jgi:hypothetical protein